MTKEDPLPDDACNLQMQNIVCIFAGVDFLQMQELGSRGFDHTKWPTNPCFIPRFREC